MLAREQVCWAQATQPRSGKPQIMWATTLIFGGVQHNNRSCSSGPYLGLSPNHVQSQAVCAKKGSAPSGWSQGCLCKACPPGVKTAQCPRHAMCWWNCHMQPVRELCSLCPKRGALYAGALNLQPCAAGVCGRGAWGFKPPSLPQWGPSTCAMPGVCKQAADSSSRQQGKRLSG